MNKRYLLYGLIGMVIGIAATAVVIRAAVAGRNTTLMQLMRIGSQQQASDETHSGMTMQRMVTDLSEKRGDAFDRSFLAEMIVHHRGAIDMARQAQQRAKHDELKRMADAIVSAQSQEIDQMQSWQADWGYTVVPTR